MPRSDAHTAVTLIISFIGFAMIFAAVCLWGDSLMSLGLLGVGVVWWVGGFVLDVV